MKWAVHVARMEEMRNAKTPLVCKHEGKEVLGRPGRRWEDNVKMDLNKIGRVGADWIHLTQNWTGGGLL
jgi:hypothetical protein